MEENILRQRVTTDVSTGSGQFDLVFIGLYETPIFAKRGWLLRYRRSRARTPFDSVMYNAHAEEGKAYRPLNSI
jgi:sorbitol/mannitol transport system substrate-binding protein